MNDTCFSGPVISYGQSPVVNGYTPDYNPNAGPSMFFAGGGIIDPRTGYQPGQASSQHVYGLSNNGFYASVNQVPSAISAVNIAAAQVPVAATPLTLVSATGAGITVGVSITSATTGRTVTGLLAIDGAAGVVTFGSSGLVAIYDPTKAIARNVRITSVGDDSVATVTVAGYDIYGYPMTETITLTNASIASGKKAFKYVATITPAGTLSGSNVSVGTGDVYGFPVRADLFGSTLINWNSTLITASTGFTAAVTTSPATATTGDVRGTYAAQSASDATKRLMIFNSIPVANLATAAGIFGVTQA